MFKLENSSQQVGKKVPKKVGEKVPNHKSWEKTVQESCRKFSKTAKKLRTNVGEKLESKKSYECIIINYIGHLKLHYLQKNASGVLKIVTGRYKPSRLLYNECWKRFIKS